MLAFLSACTSTPSASTPTAAASEVVAASAQPWTDPAGDAAPCFTITEYSPAPCPLRRGPAVIPFCRRWPPCLWSPGRAASLAVIFPAPARVWSSRGDPCGDLGDRREGRDV